MLINALTGFRSVDGALLDWLRSLKRYAAEIFLHRRADRGQEPYLFAALRVVGRWRSSARWWRSDRRVSGLGQAMWLAYADLNMPACLPLFLC